MTNTMKIQIIAPKEDPTFQNIQDEFVQAIHELQVEATVDMITRLTKIPPPQIIYPAVIIDGHLMCQEYMITHERAKECIRQWMEITK
jgi:hypothetical protein